MKEWTLPVPSQPLRLRARVTYYLFVKLSHVGESEVAKVKNLCPFNFFTHCVRADGKEDIQALFPYYPAGEDDHLKYYEYVS
jgi:hypothetical protein